MKEIMLVYITCGSKEEAEKLAEILVEKKLAACVNYFPINSIYFWKNKIEKDKEYVMICKTLKEKFSEIEKVVKENHSYEVPAIMGIPIEKISEDFYRYILDFVE